MRFVNSSVSCLPTTASCQTVQPRSPLIVPVMNDWVVASSVVVKWVLVEPDSALALQVTTDTAAKNGRLHVLDLAFVEVTNVIWTRCHRDLLTLPESRQALALLLQAQV